MGHDLKKKVRSTINLYFLCMSAGTVLSFLSIVILATTQTSINIEGDAGAITLSVASIGSIVYGIFAAPAVLKRFGPGINLVLSDISYLLYCLANYSNDVYVLVLGGLLSGLARATLLPATAICCFQLAEQFYYCGSKDREFYDSRFQGRFYSIFGTVSIIGNSISFAVLYGTTSSFNSDVPTETTTLTPIVTQTAAANYSQYEYCGVNDCNDPSIVADNIDNYVPTDRRSVYALASSASGCVLVGLLLHALIYPGIGSFGGKLDIIKIKTDIIRAQTSKKSSISSTTTNQDLTMNGVNSPNQLYEKKMDCENSAFEPNEDNNNYSIEKQEKNVSDKDIAIDFVSDATSDSSDATSFHEDVAKNESYIFTLKQTGLFFIKFQALLISLMPFKIGMIIGLTFSDVTRAYSACVAGVEWVGIIAIFFGILNIPAPIFYSWGSAHFGRNSMMVLLALVEFGYYFGLYFWVPDLDTIYVIALLFAIGGFSNGISRTAVTVIYSEYFPDEHHIAVNMWNMWLQFGTGLQYALSTFMCVDDKLYLMMALTVVANIAYAVAEIRSRRSRDSTSQENTTAQETKF